jgi:hypothetical protein
MLLNHKYVAVHNHQIIQFKQNKKFYRYKKKKNMIQKICPEHEHIANPKQMSL